MSSTASQDNEKTTGTGLHRSLGFWALVAFGVGDILGAGIYALIGEIAGIAGHASWIAFGVALIVAGMTALAYAELGGRFPKSGGEAQFCEQGFGRPGPALLVGWLVLCSGIVSIATVSLAFSGYALEFLGVNSPLARTAVAVLFLIGISGINIWGIRQTSSFNIVFTIVETSGLVLVLVVGLLFLNRESGGAISAPAATVSIGWFAILQAGALAFFAFIGFEDMVNVAEEVRNPRRNMPIAILVAVSFAGSLYMLVIWVATRVVDPAVLAESQAPLVAVVNRAAPNIPPVVFTSIALFAVANTGLLNFVTVSRLLYGMSDQNLVPQWLGALHPVRRTPYRATLVVLLVAAVLAISGTLKFLAGTTSVLILCVFLSVNLSLVSLKTFRRDAVPGHSGFGIPLVIPVVAIVTCVILIAFVPRESLIRALILVGIGFLLIAWRNWSDLAASKKKGGR